MGSIKKDVAKGVFWIAIAKYSGIVIQIIVSAILARKISPAAFGVIAVAMVILSFLNILADIGIGPAIVQYKQLTKHHLNTLFTLTFYLGTFLGIGMYFFSGMISQIYSNQALVSVCQLLSLVIFFNSLNVVPNSLMRKDKRFHTIAKRTLFFQILSGSVAVWGAFRGWGIYALLVSPTITAIGVFSVNYFYYPLRFVMRINSEVVKLVSFFSFFQFAFSFCNYFSRNLDKLIIGKYFSMTQLGYYDKSYHLMMLPIQNVSYVIEPVLHPVLSSLQNNRQELCKKNTKLAVFISNVSFPVGLILYFCAGELIRIVYGNQWDAAIPVFRILALSLPLQMILSTNVPVFQAAGKTNHLFISGMLNTICTVCGFMIAAFWGKSIEAVAWSWDITLLINFISTYFILHIFTIKESPLPFYLSLIPQFFNSLLTFLFVFLFNYFISELHILSSLLIKIVLISVLTVFFASFFKQYRFKDIKLVQIIHNSL